MLPLRRMAVRVSIALLGSLFAGESKAGPIYETINGGLSPAPFYWSLPTLGWYGTPDTDVILEGIQTKLASGFSNVDNNFEFTTTLYTDRPAAGGTELGSFTWNGATFIEGSWVGGSFAAPIALTGGTTYFIGISGWQNALGWNGPGSGAGVNWIDVSDLPGSESLGGAGSSYIDGLGEFEQYSVQLNGGPEPSTTDSPIFRFVLASDVVQTPEPSSITLLGLGAVGLLGSGYRRLRKKPRQA